MSLGTWLVRVSFFQFGSFKTFEYLWLGFQGLLLVRHLASFVYLYLHFIRSFATCAMLKELQSRTGSCFCWWAPLSSIILIVASISFAMALAEGILRLFPDLLSVELQQIVQVDPDNYGVAHPYIGYLHKPN